MRILHISTSDSGGAAKACLRLHDGLLQHKIESKVLVLDKSNDQHPEVYHFFDQKESTKLDKGKNFFKRHIIPYFNEYKLRGKVSGYEQFDFTNSLFKIQEHPLFNWCEVVNLHFVSQFLNYKTFFRNINKPIVWTLHDMNPFTGGCHYSADCIKFTEDCSLCPQLEGTGNRNYSKKILQIKILSSININQQIVVSPSNWLNMQSLKSRVFNNTQHKIINHGIDLDLYKPWDKSIGRDIFSLPKNKKIILFIADDFGRKIKGISYLADALIGYSKNDDLCLVTIGKRNTEEINFPNSYHLGYISDERLLNIAYSSADVTVVPSLQEAFSLTSLESIASGTPVVAFSGTGPDDIIQHKHNGYLAEPYSVKDLAEGILWVINNDNYREISGNARKKAETEFNIIDKSKEYSEVYNSLIIN